MSTDEAFARYLNQLGGATPEQLEAARKAQAESAQKCISLSLADVLIQQGIITVAIRENIEKKVLAVQQGIQKLGKYKLIKKLGEGGMGTVYLAEDTEMSRQVALKVLPKKFAGDATFLSRFRREIRATGNLNHVNIVTAHDAGEDMGHHYYAMEHCEGESLYARLKREVVIPSNEAIEIVMQVGRGLKHAHDHGFVHRDIKPQNIFLNKEGIAKILDLGLSKDISQSDNGFNTQTGIALGTPHYISPEQARGEKNIDGRTDIYSLGATFYHLITGMTPFDGSTGAAIMLKHLNEQIPNPQDVREDVPDGVAHVIQKMMAKYPADRYRDCGELLADLELVIDGHQPTSQAIEAVKSSVATRLHPPKPKRKSIRENVSTAEPRTINRYHINKKVAWIAVGALALALIALVVDILLNRRRNESETLRVAVGTQPKLAEAKLPESDHNAESSWMTKLKAYDSFAKQNPRAFKDIRLHLDAFDKDKDFSTEESQAELLRRRQALKGREEAEAETLIDEIGKVAEARANGYDFKGAMKELEKFPRELESTGAASRLFHVRKRIEEKAVQKFKERGNVAQKFVEEQNFYAAIRSYDLISDSGIPEIDDNVTLAIIAIRDAATASKNKAPVPATESGAQSKPPTIAPQEVATENEQLAKQYDQMFNTFEESIKTVQASEIDKLCKEMASALNEARHRNVLSRLTHVPSVEMCYCLGRGYCFIGDKLTKSGDRSSGLDNYERAIRDYNKAIKAISKLNSMDSDLWTRISLEPHAWFELGICYCKTQNYYSAILANIAFRRRFVPAFRSTWMMLPKNKDSDNNPRGLNESLRVLLDELDMPNDGLLAKSISNIQYALRLNGGKTDTWNAGLKARILIEDSAIAKEGGSAVLDLPKITTGFRNALVLGRFRPQYCKALDGDTDAQLFLGNAYAGAWGNKNDLEAARWFRMAADQENVIAQVKLADMYWYGVGVPKDYYEAVTWYRKAAQQEQIPVLGKSSRRAAQDALGTAYMKGVGAPQNDLEAIKWFMKAADKSDPVKENNLGCMYRDGKGVAQSDTEAVKFFCKSAAKGNGDAQCSLGGMYCAGRGVKQNFTEAVRWFRKSAEQGNAWGQCNLGIMYREGKGVTQSDTEAVSWYRKSAEQGNAWGQCNLGCMYRDGKGVTQSDFEAVNWFFLSAKQNNANGQFCLGWMYYNGRGVEQNFDEAERWYRKAAELGYEEAKKELLVLEGMRPKRNDPGTKTDQPSQPPIPDAGNVKVDDAIIRENLAAAEHGDAAAQAYIGWLYLNGNGVPKNELEAFKWTRRAADQGNPGAEFNLGTQYFFGQGIEKSETEAVKWYRKAADHNFSQAQYTLGCLYQSGAGVATDTAEAVKWFLRAAKQGYALAELSLSAAYYNGTGVLKDEVEAAKWCRKAADQGLAGSQYVLGIAYANGNGVPKNEGEAVTWYRRAAEQDLADAQYALGVAYAMGKGVTIDDAEAVKWFRKAAEQGNENAKVELKGRGLNVNK